MMGNKSVAGGRRPAAGRGIYSLPSSAVLSTMVLLYLAAGCSSSAPAAPPTSPTTSPPSSRPTTTPAGQGVLTVTVVDTGGKPVGGAEVQVRGVVAADGQTDEQGAVQFPNLPVDPDYTVVVMTPGFGITSRSSVGVRTGQETQVSIPVTLAASISGSVQANGQAIAGAVVSNGTLSTLSRSDGSFALSSVASGPNSLAIGKTGFQLARRAGIDVPSGSTVSVGTIPLTPLGRPVQVLFDSSQAPLGGNENLATYFADLIQTLRGAGFQVSVGPAGDALPDLSNTDILVVTSPTRSYSNGDLSAIRSFVAAGHKLILLGEWGGFGGVGHDALNSLAAGFNLGIGPDLVKDFDPAGQAQKRADYLVVSRFVPHPLTTNISSVTMFDAASVDVARPAVSAVDPNAAVVVARTSYLGLQVADTFNSNYGVAGAALSGAGTVVVLGDASLWSSSDTDGSGKANLFKLNNKDLALNAFGW